MLTRRGLLGAGLAVAGTATLAACTDDPALPPPEPPAVKPGDWPGVRAQFNLRADHAHFAAFVLASHPATVRAAIDRHRAGLDADAHGYLADEGGYEARVKLAAGQYLGSTVDQIAFTDSTTMGLGLLYGGLALQPGDEILTTDHDFYATHEALRLRTLRDGTVVRRARLYTDPATASVGEIVDGIRKGLTDRTRVVAVTWVHSSTGVRLPIKEIAEVVHARPGVLLCVDGVHGLGAVDASPADMGADFLVSGTHKWLFGPRGTGIVWGSPAGWERTRAIIPSFELNAIGAWITGQTGTSGFPVTPAQAGTPGGYHSFEHRWALAEAFTFHNTLGRAAIAKRTTELATKLKDGLRGIDGVRIHTPMAPELSAGLVCCTIGNYQAARAVDELRKRKVLTSVTPYATAYVRFGAGITTLESDVDAAIEAVRDLA